MQILAGLEVIDGRDLVRGLRYIAAGVRAPRYQAPHGVALTDHHAIVVRGARRVDAGAPDDWEGEHQHEGEQLDEGNESRPRFAAVREHRSIPLRLVFFEHMFVRLILSPARSSVKGF